jgi:hypothetical protein
MLRNFNEPLSPRSKVWPSLWTRQPGIEMLGFYTGSGSPATGIVIPAFWVCHPRRPRPRGLNSASLEREVLFPASPAPLLSCVGIPPMLAGLILLSGSVVALPGLVALCRLDPNIRVPLLPCRVLKAVYRCRLHPRNAPGLMGSSSALCGPPGLFINQGLLSVLLQSQMG